MNINVELKHVTPLNILVEAIRQCYESQDKSDSGVFQTSTPYFSDWQLGPKDKALIERICSDGHASTLEHITFNFQIKGISRLNLQELARHRMASYSVKSTRYTLKELKNESSFFYDETKRTTLPVNGKNRAAKYINFTGIEDIDLTSILALEQLRKLVCSGEFTNDQTKYALPECYRLDLYWTINARSLQNFLTLRLSHRAHFEIRELAQKVYEAIPEEYKFLFKVDV